MRHGLYRIRGVDGLPNDVRVEDDGIDIPMEEKVYRARGYLPSFDDLPWHEAEGSRRPRANDAGPTDPLTERADREQARKDFQARFNKR